MPDDKFTIVKTTISGRVQGVGFRAWTRNQARKLGIRGWVKNNSSGQVEALFAGWKENVEKMLVKCKRGPMLAKVDRIDITNVDTYLDNEDFLIIKE